jgi:hypothetical protein
VPPTDRLRWAWAGVGARLERLSPFWTAYSLTLTETVGATILALPIALATIGPLPGVAMLVVLGLVNIVTIACMSEAVVRSGAIRYGSAYLGRLVGDYLGTTGSLILSVSLFVLCLLTLPVFYIGVSTTLEDATSVWAPVWVGVGGPRAPRLDPPADGQPPPRERAIAVGSAVRAHGRSADLRRRPRRLLRAYLG